MVQGGVQAGVIQRVWCKQMWCSLTVLERWCIPVTSNQCGSVWCKLDVVQASVVQCGTGQMCCRQVQCRLQVLQASVV